MLRMSIWTYVGVVKCIFLENEGFILIKKLKGRLFQAPEKEQFLENGTIRDCCRSFLN